MMMEHGAQAGLVTHRPRDTLGALREDTPLLVVQSLLGTDAPGIDPPLVDAAVIIRQHNERAAIAGIAKQPRYLERFMKLAG